MGNKDKGKREKKKPAKAHMAQPKVALTHTREEFGQVAARIAGQATEKA